ncbi:MAG: hypothetical protein IJM51_11855 [Clostridia bacterium]|nr:hypothetical protein [Clostridia bacterium]
MTNSNIQHTAADTGGGKNSRLALRILAAVGGLLIVAVVLFFYNAFCGNFISGTYYRNKVVTYINETYPGKGYEVSGYQYNFKDGSYWFDITDPASEDGCFTACYSRYEGGVIDTYDRVIHLTNTAERLERGFRGEVDPILDRHLQTKERVEEGTFISGEFGYATCLLDDFYYDAESEDAYIRDRLWLDMPFDPKNMPLPTKIYVNLHGDREQAFQRTKEIADELRALGYRIDYFDFATSATDETDDVAYEMIPAEVFFSANSTEDFSDYIVRYYDNPDIAPTTTRATFATQATIASSDGRK